jgi:hypothetical protein
MLSRPVGNGIFNRDIKCIAICAIGLSIFQGAFAFYENISEVIVSVEMKTYFF